MKSRFFGLSAKFALAALAVGFTFASCYDSTSESVIVPSTPTTTPTIELPAPSYQVYGYVTDAVTGEAIEGVEVVTPIGRTTTDVSGYYQVVSKTASNGAIIFTKSGYDTKMQTLNVTQIDLGTALYQINVALTPEGAPEPEVPEVKLVDTETAAENAAEAAKETVVAPIELATALEVANASDEASAETVEVEMLSGIRWNEAMTRAGEMEAFVEVILQKYGVRIADDFAATTQAVPVTIPPKATLAAVKVAPRFRTERYEVNGQEFIIDIIESNVVSPLYVGVQTEVVDGVEVVVAESVEAALVEVETALDAATEAEAVEAFDELFEEQKADYEEYLSTHNGGIIVSE